MTSNKNYKKRKRKKRNEIVSSLALVWSPLFKMTGCINVNILDLQIMSGKGKSFFIYFGLDAVRINLKTVIIFLGTGLKWQSICMASLFFKKK